ncbi:MAG: TSUP family transporter, partial [Pseudomonadales bacterium]
LNWAKVPAFFALGELDQTNLTIAAILMPFAILSTLAGVWLVRRIDPDRFYRLIYGLMILLGVKLVYDALP